MRVLILGSGGREHALAWAVSQSRLATDVVCAPGSAGIAEDARILPVAVNDPAAVLDLARSERSDLVIVGPEAPLVAGVADRLVAQGIKVFGPSAAAARLEGSKAFAKAFMQRHRVPTPGYQVFTDADEADRYVDQENKPVVVKADGLAAGKGVTVCDGPEAAKRAIQEIMRENRFGDAGERIVVEDCLVGEEASFYAISDGERFTTLPSAQDHKRLLDGDRGENTGGMGAYTPAPVVDAVLERKVIERIVRPTLQGMLSEGHPYVGVLYVGLMVVNGEPFVIEYNVRFGDPETQPILFGLEADPLIWLRDAARGRLAPETRGLRLRQPAVCVVMASDGYPRNYPTGYEIEGIDAANALEGVKVFHAGTSRTDGTWYTAGGRVLGVTARASSIADAKELAYQAAAEIRFKGAVYRSDIGHLAFARGSP